MYRSTFSSPRHMLEVSGQLYATPATLPRGKSPRYLLERRLDGPQSRSGRRGEVKMTGNDDSLLNKHPRPSISFFTDDDVVAPLTNSE
jgi:hypothetical protein